MATIKKTIKFTPEELRHFRMAAFDVATLAGGLKMNNQILVSDDTGEIIDYHLLAAVVETLEVISRHSFTVEDD